MIDKRDLAMAEVDLWIEYTEKVDSLHREATRMDRSGKLGYVYLAEMSIDGHYDPNAYAHIKIGRSRNPSNRIREWSKTNVKMPYRIREMASFWCENTPLVEKYLHNRFAEHREAGEWFWLPFDIQHAFYGLWYVSTYGEHDDKMQFRDISGGWHEPEEFFEKELKEYYEEGERQRSWRAAREAEEREAES